MIVLEIVAAINSGGTLQTFYVSTDRFVTSGSDTPSNQYFNPCIIQPGSIGLHAFSDGRTTGSTRLQNGDIVLANSDGLLDAWLAYSFDGRALTIRSGLSTGAYPSSFSTLFTGTVESIEASWDQVIIKLKDKQFVLDLPVLTTTYAGTNALPAGLEGVAGDLLGKVKPRVYGSVYNISPAFVNTSKLTYQVSDGAVNSIAAVYDGGSVITPGADFANSTLLQAAAPGAGTFITCIAEGYFRLGTTPVGTITADVVQGANAAARTVAQITKTLGLAAGLSSGEISSADVTAMDTANSSVVGIFIDDSSTYQNVIDQLLASVGGFTGFDSSGALRMGVLTAPSGTAVVTLKDYNIMTDISRTLPKDNGIPVWRVTVGYQKIFTVQTSGLVAAATAVQRAYLASQYRTSISSDSSIQTQWKLSTPFEVDGLLTVKADADTEAARLLALYKVKRTIYEVPIDASIFTVNSLKLLDVISLDINRFDLSGGKKHRLIGYNFDLSSNKIILSLWG